MAKEERTVPRAHYLSHNVTLNQRPDRAIVLTSAGALGPVADRTTDWLDHWAALTPDAVFLAERSGAGWHELSYRAAREQARAMAGGLLELGLGPDAPIMIVTGNSVNHGLLALAAQYVGVPIVPLAEQYALIPEARSQLDYVAGLTCPGAIYAEDGAAFSDVMARACFSGIHKLVGQGAGTGHIPLAGLTQTGGNIDDAAARVGDARLVRGLLAAGAVRSMRAPRGGGVCT
jgi:feruloyl-CoA synthase